jgi:hypothetical protein
MKTTEAIKLLKQTKMELELSFTSLDLRPIDELIYRLQCEEHDADTEGITDPAVIVAALLSEMVGSNK